MKATRRQFMQTAAAAGVMLGAPFVHAAAKDAKLRTALIGCGWWGKNILREAMASGRCKVTALCDVDSMALEVAIDQVGDQTSDQPKGYKDFRDLFAKEKPDIAIVATPDHWHALQGIAAVQAGANLYIEKPTAHTVNESRALLKAARDSGSVVQVGLHRRIGPHHVSAKKFVQSGGVGQIGMARAFADSGGGKENPANNTQPPETLDWNMWCGPAPLRPFNNRLHPGGWRGFLDYANGQLGDWGVHWLDQIAWMTEEKYPTRIFSSGGRPIRGVPVNDGKRQTTDQPDHQVAVYEFEKFTATWEHRLFAGNSAEKHRIGVYFYGTKGTLHVGWRDGWTFYSTNPTGQIIHEKAQLQEPDGHNIKLLFADFLQAIDQKTRPVADIEPAHRSTVMALLGMASMRAGRSLAWDGSREQIPDDPQANALLAREYRAPWQYPGVAS